MLASCLSIRSAPPNIIQPSPLRNYMIATTYATRAEAEADNWRRINRSTDRDVTEGPFMGYTFEALDRQRSTQIYLTKEQNRLGREGAFVQMFRKQAAADA